MGENKEREAVTERETLTERSMVMIRPATAEQLTVTKRSTVTERPVTMEPENYGFSDGATAELRVGSDRTDEVPNVR